MTEQTELTFSAGERATLDLRDSEGDVRIEDGEPETVRISSSGGRSPFVLREGGHLPHPPRRRGPHRRRPGHHDQGDRPCGGAPAPHPAGRDGGHPPGACGDGAGAAGSGRRRRRGRAPAPAKGPPPVDLSEFARYMSEQSRRIFDQMTEKVRQGGFDANVATEDVARRLDEAAGRIDEQVQRVAVRVEREVERAFDFVGRAAKRTEGQHRHEVHRQHRAEERAQRHAERSGERAQRATERATERAGRRPHGGAGGSASAWRRPSARPPAESAARRAGAAGRG